MDIDVFSLCHRQRHLRFLALDAIEREDGVNCSRWCG